MPSARAAVLSNRGRASRNIVCKRFGNFPINFGSCGICFAAAASNSTMLKASDRLTNSAAMRLPGAQL